MPGAQDVLSYWFDGGGESESEIWAQIKRWFQGGPSVDAEIRERFTGLVEQARLDALDDWANTASGRLALILVLDQFTRNVYRGSPDAFASDRKAQRLAQEGIDRGMYDQLGSLYERMFFTMPLGHAEDLDAQRLAVHLSQRLQREAQGPHKKIMLHSVEQARKHLDVIARFGRFPTRNAILGRQSTPDEQAYLDFLAANDLFL